MDVELFGFCEQSTSRGHHLDVTGLFNIIRLPQFPCVLQRLPLIARLRFFSGEEGDHHFSFRLLDADRAPLGPAIETIIPVTMDEGFLSQWVHAISAIRDLRIHKPQEAALEGLLDGRLVADAPLLLIQA